MDLKNKSGEDGALALAGRADALIEGFRPGVMERLGLGPDELLARNPRLVYGRMTGYGQNGPMAATAGHDIDYIFSLVSLARPSRVGELGRWFAINTVGDYGGGAMLLAFGVVCGLLEARASGRGQVIDAAMIDGAALLTAPLHGLHAAGSWSRVSREPTCSTPEHTSPRVYRASGGSISPSARSSRSSTGRLRGAAGPRALGMEMPQWDRERWPEFKAHTGGAVRDAAPRLSGRSCWRVRDAWCHGRCADRFEAPADPHLMARGTFVEFGRGCAAGAGAAIQPDGGGGDAGPGRRRRGGGALGARRAGAGARLSRARISSRICRGWSRRSVQS